MIKYIKSRISVKIFLLTMVILMAVSGVSYGFVTGFYAAQLFRFPEPGRWQQGRSSWQNLCPDILWKMHYLLWKNSAVRISLEWFFLKKMVELSGSGMDLGMRLMITSEIEGSSEGVSEEFASTVETMEAE